MSAQITPAKRPLDHQITDVSARRKWKKPATLGSDNTTSMASPSSKVIRVLCPASITGGIIGKGGSIISQIRQETGAKVRVDETVPGCDERVIVIVGSDKAKDTVSEVVKAEEGEEAKIPESGENPEKQEEGDEKQDVPVDDSKQEKEKENPSVQNALLFVFDRMINLLSGANEGDEESKKLSSYVVRLLVFSGQVGCLLGKAGSVIKQMSSESGAQIRILPKDKLPSCASSSDELVQISGGLDAIKKALLSVSQNLLEHIPRNQDSFPVNPLGPSSHSFAAPRLDRFPPPNRPFHGHEAPYPSGFHDGDTGIHGRMNFPPEIITFRVLCNEEKVGGVIGKGGCIIKSLQHETGCDIKVLEGTGNAEDRIIIISGPAYPDDAISPPQDAVLQVQTRIFRSAPESKDNTTVAKLLVGSHQIGCLLGKGGSVIAEMRKSTGAYIRILGKDQVPKNASENEEVVQVTGVFEVVQEALMQITLRLKYHFFRDILPPMGHPSNPPFLEQMPPFPPYMGRREFSPSGTFSNRGPPFNNFDDQPPFGHDYPRPGIPPHISERMPPAAPWGPPGPIDGPGPMGFPDYPGAPPRRLGGFVGANQQAVITNNTVEVVVPRYVIPAIYGEEGGCLRHIREFSDAKITITDPKPAASETVIVISGTPEQTNAAQSLIQAFVICETEAN